MISLAMKHLLTFLFACTWLASAVAWSHEGHEQGSRVSATSLAVSLAFDQHGRLWRAGVQDGFVTVAYSDDLGRHFSNPQRLNPEAQKIGIEGDARPKIAVAPGGRIYVTWTQALPKPYTGYIWFARSTDGGNTFSPPAIVHHDRAEITHRFDAVAVAGKDGQRIYVAWVDKRDLLAAEASRQPYEGAAIYYAVSEDGGASFQPEQKLADHSCECCRIALAGTDNGEAVALWRHVFPGNIRDHAITRFAPGQALPAESIHRASFGRWNVEACPHHGPTIAQGGDWGWHMAWFDGSTDNKAKSPGLYYARMDGEAWVSSPAMRFGNSGQQAGHPALLSQGEQVWLVWRELDDDGSAIWLKSSTDGGRNWTDARQVVSTTGRSDYPQLLSHGSRAYLAWNTEKEGILMKRLDADE